MGSGVRDRLDAILRSRDHTVLNAAVEQCRSAMQKLQPELYLRGLLDPLIDESVAPWYKRFVVLAFVVFSDAVRVWVAEGCVPMRFDPFWFHLNDRMRVYLYQQVAPGVPSSETARPYYHDAFHLVVEMCQCYMNEIDHAGRWLATERARGYRSPYDAA